jgi:hypothetical protein
MPPADSNVYLASTVVSYNKLEFRNQLRVSTSFMNKMCFDVYVLVLVLGTHILFRGPTFFSNRCRSVKSSPDRDSNPGSALQQKGALTIE